MKVETTEIKEINKDIAAQAEKVVELGKSVDDLKDKLAKAKGKAVSAADDK